MGKEVTSEILRTITKVQIFMESGEWKESEFKKIKKGDIFKMFDGDRVVCDVFGNDVWQATEKAYYDKKKKIYTADCKPVATTSG